MSGAQICFLAEDDGLKWGLSQKLCCFCSLQAFLYRLDSEGWDTRSDCILKLSFSLLSFVTSIGLGAEF